MSTTKKVVIIMLVAIVAVGGYFGYQIVNSQTTVEIPQVELLDIKNEQTKIILNGTVATKETKSFIYDYTTYGKHWSTPVTLGQHVNEGDIIVEGSKKDFKAPFDGYITELNVEAAYEQAKKADDNNEMVMNPEVLFTIVSSDFFIDTKLTEYEIARLPEAKNITYSIRAKDVNTSYPASIRLLSSTPITAQPSATGQTSSDISSYSLTLNMDGGKELARVGNHVTVRIEDANQQALVIPKTALLEENGKTYVYLFKETTDTSGTITKSEITGSAVENGFRVETGLSTGDRIVTNDVANLVDGGIVNRK